MERTADSSQAGHHAESGSEREDEQGIRPGHANGNLGADGRNFVQHAGDGPTREKSNQRQQQRLLDHDADEIGVVVAEGFQGGVLGQTADDFARQDLIDDGGADDDGDDDAGHKNQAIVGLPDPVMDFIVEHLGPREYFDIFRQDGVKLAGDGTWVARTIDLDERETDLGWRKLRDAAEEIALRHDNRAAGIEPGAAGIKAGDFEQLVVDFDALADVLRAEFAAVGGAEFASRGGVHEHGLWTIE